MVRLLLTLALFERALSRSVRELGAHAAVEHEVAERATTPPMSAGSSSRLEDDRLARASLERLPHALELGRIERLRRGHVRAHAAGVLVDQRAVGARDVGSGAMRPRSRSSITKFCTSGVSATRGRRLSMTAALLERRRSGSRAPCAARASRATARRRVELLAELLEGAAVDANREQRARVAARDRAGERRHQAPSRRASRRAPRRRSRTCRGAAAGRRR